MKILILSIFSFLFFNTLISAENISVKRSEFKTVADSLWQADRLNNSGRYIEAYTQLNEIKNKIAELNKKYEVSLFSKKLGYIDSQINIIGDMDKEALLEKMKEKGVADTERLDAEEEKKRREQMQKLQEQQQRQEQQRRVEEMQRRQEQQRRQDEQMRRYQQWEQQERQRRQQEQMRRDEQLRRQQEQLRKQTY